MSVIGIPVIFTGDHWIGGLNYYMSLISTLTMAPQSDFKFVIITNKPGVLDRFISESVSIHVDESLGKNSIAQKIINKFFDCDLKLVRVVNLLNIDLLTHTTYSKKYRCKTIWWKPDFQEQYYPEFFSKRELWERKRAVERNAKHASIIFSSQNACDDYHQFYKEKCHSYVLNFVPLLDLHTIDEEKVQSVLDKYNIKSPFFYLPNQFWVHKNHELVLQSIIQRNHDLDFEVISTGVMKDYRGQGHIEKIKKLIEQIPDNKFRTLGLVPREDMLALMHASLAVINPSKFEGWSTTVEEAKYSGKRIILSSLPVHKEQCPPDSIFIDIDDIEAMSDAIRHILNSYNIEKENERRRAAEVCYKRDRLEFSLNYFKIIRKELSRC
ncbi:glycosyltransferase [Citrobacter freundii]|uniref:glycosyltransferase n=1 Tax=Citrobacter freundii TaxID=546 RepID=UPI0015F3E8E1|nr:glycosyltransferase [Citrobacter freundii]